MRYRLRWRGILTGCGKTIALLAIIALLFALCGCDRLWSAEPDATVRGQEENESVIAGNASEEESLRQDERARVFLFFSDTQPNPETGDFSGLGKLMEQVALRHEAPDLVVFGGDTVNDGGDEAEWREFWMASGSWLKGLTTAAVAGNHDSYALLAEQFNYPDRAPATPYGGFFYTLSVGSVYFVMLDSNIMGAGNRSDVEWLQNALQGEAAGQSDWIIAVMHHPMWPVTDNPKDQQRAATMREHFMPLLEAYGVALILCGHQHVYARSRPMLGESESGDGRGIVQIMAASGDKVTYAQAERSYIAAGASAPNYLVLRADSESLCITAFDSEHAIIDEFTVSK